MRFTEFVLSDVVFDIKFLFLKCLKRNLMIPFGTSTIGHFNS